MANKYPLLQNRLFYVFLFLASSLLIIAPLLFRIDLARLQSLGLLGIFVFNFISSSTVFFPAPGFLATGIGGSLYNPLLVALASSAGSSAGESVGFAFGYSSKQLGRAEKNKLLQKLREIIHHKYGPFVIILLAFIPNPFFDIVGVLAGLASYPVKKFLLLVFTGRFLRDLIIAYVASSIA